MRRCLFTLAVAAHGGNGEQGESTLSPELAIKTVTKAGPEVFAHTGNRGLEGR